VEGSVLQASSRDRPADPAGPRGSSSSLSTSFRRPRTRAITVHTGQGLLSPTGALRTDRSQTIAVEAPEAGE
jgi:hypothetical protein